jgi:hypothetical protein
LYRIIPVTGEEGRCAVVPEGRKMPPDALSIAVKIPDLSGKFKV